MKYFVIVLLLIVFACSQPKKEPTFTTADLHLNADIKHITQQTELGAPETIDIEFENNRIISLKTARPDVSYTFNYDDNNLVNITSRFTEVKPQEFPLAFQLMQPLLMYNADSLILNDQRDPIRVFFKEKENHPASEYRIEYTYDQLHNWIVRELYCHSSESPLERTERTFLYTRKTPQHEITSWNAKSDSIYATAKERNSLIATIDSTIATDQARMKKMIAYINKFQKEVIATDDSVTLLSKKFDTIYGIENLSPELQQLKRKLTVLRAITQREKFLWNEASTIIPWLLNSEKKVTDTIEPYTDRYVLTYTNELLAGINYQEKIYESYVLGK